MYFIKSISDVVVVLLLLRMLIKPAEAFFDPISQLIYRITDKVLVPARQITRNHTKALLLSVFAVVLLRGLLYHSFEQLPYAAGIGTSFLSLIRLLFQAYIVIWIISLLSRRSSMTDLNPLMDRALEPLLSLYFRLGMPKKQFQWFVFIFLWVLYSILNTCIRFIISIAVPKIISSPFSIFHGLAEGLILVVGLFPGFFSLVIIIGALLSWVSPDPSNRIVQIIYSITEPLLMPFRRIVPNLGGLDLSPLLAILCFQILGSICQNIIVKLMQAI